MRTKSKVLIVLGLLIIIGIIFCGSKFILQKKEVEKIQKVQSTTEEFIQQIKDTGKLTDTSYNKLIDELNSTGYVYELELTINTLSKPSMKQGEVTVMENQFYNIYTNQIIEELNNEGVYYLNVGDIITANIKSPKGEINGHYTGTVIVNGNKYKNK